MNNISRQKMGKSARRKLDASARKTWQGSPVTRLKPSEKIYNRKKRRSGEDSESALRASSQTSGEMV